MRILPSYSDIQRHPGISCAGEYLNIGMAKAHITTSEGVTIKLDGTPDEIAAVIAKIRNPSEAVSKTTAGRKDRRKPQRILLVDLIDSLVDGGFFKKPRDLAAVKAALAELGHHYPMTTLSGAMLRKVRNRRLRRLKEDSRWVYTGVNK